MKQVLKPTRRASPAAVPAAAARRDSLAMAGVLLVTALAYLRLLANGFTLDDHDNIVANPYIGQWSFIWKSLVHDPFWFRDPLHLPQSSYYRPFHTMWLGLNYQLFGLNPAPWHAMMLSLHLITVWLVFRIAAHLTGRWESALLAALLFGLLPANAETVVWISGITHLLSGLFEIAALYAFAERAGSSRRNWALALLLYAAALLSLDNVATFVGLIGAYVFLLERPRGNTESERFAAVQIRIAKAALCMAPFAVEAILYLVARRLVLGFFLHQNEWITRMTPATIVLTLPRVIENYLLLLVLPWKALARLIDGGQCGVAGVLAFGRAS